MIKVVKMNDRNNIVLSLTGVVVQEGRNEQLREGQIPIANVRLNISPDSKPVYESLMIFGSLAVDVMDNIKVGELLNILFYVGEFDINSRKIGYQRESSLESSINVFIPNVFNEGNMAVPNSRILMYDNLAKSVGELSLIYLSDDIYSIIKAKKYIECDGTELCVAEIAIYS